MVYKCWAKLRDVAHVPERTLDLTPDDFAVNGNSISVQSSKPSFIGSIFTRSAHLTIIGHNDWFRESGLGSTSVRFNLYISNVASPTSEDFVRVGLFTVTDHRYNGDDTIEIDAIDYTERLNKTYVPTITFPNSIYNVFDDVCARCGIGNGGYALPEITITNPISGYTGAEVVSFIAEMVGGIAHISYQDVGAYLTISRIESSAHSASSDQFAVPFSEWALGSPTYDAVTHTISGVMATVKTQNAPQGENVMFGNESGVMYRFESPLELFDEGYFEDNIASNIIGLSYQLFNGESYDDALYFTYAMNRPNFFVGVNTYLGGQPYSFYSFITSATFSFIGGLTLACDILNDNADYASKAQSDARAVAENSLEKYQGAENAGKFMVVDDVGNAVPKWLILRGEADAPIASGSVGSAAIDINFDYTFSAPPIVNATARHNSNAGLSAHIRNITTTGCTVQATVGAATTGSIGVKIDWSAIGI